MSPPVEVYCISKLIIDKKIIFAAANLTLQKPSTTNKPGVRKNDLTDKSPLYDYYRLLKKLNLRGISGKMKSFNILKLF